LIGASTLQSSLLILRLRLKRIAQLIRICTAFHCAAPAVHHRLQKGIHIVMRRIEIGVILNRKPRPCFAGQLKRGKRPLACRIAVKVGVKGELLPSTPYSKSLQLL
jgi:hypothetical protein